MNNHTQNISSLNTGANSFGITPQTLYSQVRSDAIALNHTATVVSHTGTILANPNKVRRIDIVKEQIQTWYYLSETLLNTAYVSSLKPEFCELLQKMIQDYQKAPRKNQQNWTTKIERSQWKQSQNSTIHADKLTSPNITQPVNVDVRPPQDYVEQQLPESKPEWKNVSRGFKAQPTKGNVPALQELNRFKVLADLSEDPILSPEEIKSFVSDLTSVSSSKSILLKAKAKVAEQRQVVELRKLEIQCEELDQKAQLQKAQQELQLLEITERKEAITLRRIQQGLEKQLETPEIINQKILSEGEALDYELIHLNKTRPHSDAPGYGEYLKQRGLLTAQRLKLQNQLTAHMARMRNIYDSEKATEYYAMFDATVHALAEKSTQYATQQIEDNQRRKPHTSLNYSVTKPTTLLQVTDNQIYQEIAPKNIFQQKAQETNEYAQTFYKKN